MPLRTILTKLEEAWESVSEKGPDGIRAAAEMMHKTDVAMFKVADFIENLSPNAASTDDPKDAFGVSAEKLEEIKADLNHLKEEINAKDFSSAQSADASAMALPPGLQALLVQLIMKGIEKLLERIK